MSSHPLPAIQRVSSSVQTLEAGWSRFEHIAEVSVFIFFTTNNYRQERVGLGGLRLRVRHQRLSIPHQGTWQHISSRHEVSTCQSRRGRRRCCPPNGNSWKVLSGAGMDSISPSTEPGMVSFLLAFSQGGIRIRLNPS